MGEAKVILSEVDNSNYVSSEGQVYAGICLYTPKGDATKPTLVTSINQLYSRYIGDQKFTQGCDIGLYSARKFLEMGSNLWVSRVCTESETIGAVSVPYASSTNFKEYPEEPKEGESKSYYHSAEDVSEALGGDESAVVFYTKNPGAWGSDLSIDIVKPIESTSKVEFKEDTKIGCTVSIATGASALWDKATNFIYSDGSLEESDIFPVSITAFSAGSASNPERVTVCKIKKGTTVYTASVNDCYLKYVSKTAKTEASGGTPAVPEQIHYRLFLDKEQTTEILPNAEGDKVVISARTNDYTSIEGAYIITVKDGKGNVVERYVASNDPKSVDGFGTSTYVENVLKNSSNIGVVRPASETPTTFSLIARGIKFSKASGGTVNKDNVSSISSARIASAKAFLDKDSYPMTVLMDGGEDNTEYKKTLIDIAATRRDCVAIISTRSEDEKSVDPLSAVIDFRKNVLNANSSFGACFGPHVEIYDEDTASYVDIAPDGYIAGLISRAKETGEIWFPIAGLNRGVLDSALDVAVRFTDAERDMLVDNQINPIRFYSGQGIVVWGNETLRSVASATQSLHVRLLLMTIEPAMAKALEGLLFEMNDDLTRDTAKVILDSYLDDIVSRRGISEKRVVCDTKTNNMPIDLDNNRMIVDVFVTPVGYVKTIKLNVTVQSNSISITDEE